MFIPLHPKIVQAAVLSCCIIVFKVAMATAVRVLPGVLARVSAHRTVERFLYMVSTELFTVMHHSYDHRQDTTYYKDTPLAHRADTPPRPQRH